MEIPTYLVRALLVLEPEDSRLNGPHLLHNRGRGEHPYPRGSSGSDRGKGGETKGGGRGERWGGPEESREEGHIGKLEWD
jgi:hypothetical protein